MFSRALRQHIRHTRSYATQPPAKQRTFDRSMLYPAFLVVLLGSQVINVMNAQRRVEDLERRYSLKMAKMDEIIAKVRSGEAVDVEREMTLVNKVFTRGRGAYSVMGPGSVRAGKEEQLVLNEDMDDLTEEKIAAMLGLIMEVPKQEIKEAQEVKKTSTTEIKVNRSEIDQQMKNEKELLSYKLEPESHLIVETPGDYVDAAKDTKVKTFL